MTERTNPGRRSPQFLSTFSLAGLALVGAATWANAKAPQEGTVTDAGYAKAAAFAEPGRMHALLGELAGRYRVSGSRRNGPEEPWTDFSAVMEKEAILGDRFLSERLEGDGLSGRGILGYDNFAEEFTSVWIDASGTGTMIARGGSSAFSGAAEGGAGGTLELEGTFADAAANDKTRWFRVTWTLVSESEHEQRVTLRTPEGREYDIMKMNFTR